MTSLLQLAKFTGLSLVLVRSSAPRSLSVRLSFALFRILVQGYGVGRYAKGRFRSSLAREPIVSGMLGVSEEAITGSSVRGCRGSVSSLSSEVGCPLSQADRRRIGLWSRKESAILCSSHASVIGVGELRIQQLSRSLLTRKLHVAAEPCKTFKDAFTGGRTAGLDFPGVVFCYPLQIKHVRYLLRPHRCKHILISIRSLRSAAHSS